jgi:peptidyl-prolyl cis-trans isomerase SurA
MFRISTKLQSSKPSRSKFDLHLSGVLITLLGITILHCCDTASAESIIIDAVVATVDENPITLREVEKRLSTHRKLSPSDLHSDLDAQQTLDNIIAERILLAEGKEKRVGVSDAEINDYIEEVARRNQLTRVEFETVLAKEGKTIDWYKRQVHNDILKTKIVSSMTHGGVSVSEHEIDSYLEGRGDTNDSTSPTLRLRVIGIDHAGKTPEDIAKKIEDIKHRLNSGSKFADVAMAYSDGPNKAQGGILGLIAETDLHSEVFDAVFALDEGAFSEPVVTNTSTQIFYVEQRFSSDDGDDDTSSNEALREEARKAIQQRKTEEKLSSYFAIDIYKNHIVDRKF